MSDGERLVAELNAGRSPGDATLGATVEAASRAEGRVEVGFKIPPRFCHSGGIQGGFVSGMLEVAMIKAMLAAGAAGAAGASGRTAASVRELNVSFYLPARPGRLRARGEVVGREGAVWFLAASLDDADGRTVAKATATAFPAID